MNDLPKLPMEHGKEIKERQRTWLVRQLKQRGHGARAALARHLGVRSDAITRMTNLTPHKEARDISFEELIGMAEFFEATPPGLGAVPLPEQGENAARRNLGGSSRESLLARHGHVGNVSGGGQRIPDVIPGTALVGEVRDLPVFGTAQGGKGAMVLTSEPVDWTVRSPSLLRVRDGYGIIVTGDSMSPEHKAGSTALVNPHLPRRSGDTCIFRSHHDDGEVLICIKELIRETDEFWYVKQHNPKKVFTLKKAEWQVCHVTVGNFFR